MVRKVVLGVMPISDMVPWTGWTTLKQHSENVEPQKQKRRRKPRWRMGAVDRKKKVTTGRVLPQRSKNCRPSASSLKELCDAATKAREQRPRPFRISRTVELLSQMDDGWREPKSKLLYMTALGLTPILHKTGVPFVRCSVSRLQLQPSPPDKKQHTTRIQSESEIEIIDLTQDSEDEVVRNDVTTSLHHRHPVLYELFRLIQRIEDRDRTTGNYRNKVLTLPSQPSQSKSDEDDVVFLSQQTTNDDDVVILN